MLKIKEEIKDWLDKYNVKHYHINEDLTVDGLNISLIDLNLTEIPIKFNNVMGYFSCAKNKLKNLNFAPKFVEHSFFCNKNKLTSLLGSPQILDIHFDCSHNKLKSLVGGPVKVGRFYGCDNNELETLKGCPEEIIEGLDASNNKLKTLEFCPKVCGDFNVSNNYIENLLFFPKKITKSMLLVDNEDLGLIQFLSDKNQAYKIHSDFKKKFLHHQELESLLKDKETKKFKHKI